MAERNLNMAKTAREISKLVAREGKTIGIGSAFEKPEEQSNVFKAKLVHFRNKEKVIFEASPAISESRTINYQQIDPIHMPGSIFAYATTPSRNFGISDIKLISQTSAQASRNMRDLQILRYWCMPRFGSIGGDNFGNTFGADVNNSFLGRNSKTISNDNQLGMPPPLLFFSAYSASQSGGGSSLVAQNINRVPVVITSLDIQYPNDVDYIPNEKGVPFPTIMTINISLSETHSPKTFEAFNLDAFKAGTLGGF